MVTPAIRFVVRLAPLFRVLALLFVFGLSACDAPKSPPDAQASAETQVASPVLVQLPQERVMQLAVRTAATIEATVQVKVSAEASGLLQDLRVQEGDEVRPGQLLARIKREAQSASVRRAKTSLAQAKREFARVLALSKKGVVGQQELDQAKDRVDLARLDISDRGRDLANTKVTTPIGGVVTQRAAQAGDYVGAGQTLLEIMDFSTLVARVHVAERELDRIAVGQPVKVVGKAALGRRAEGKILRIAPTVDAATGTVKVTVGLPPQALASASDFRPGMYAQVTIKIQERQGVLSLPKSAVLHEEGRASVMVAADGVAKRVTVELGQRDGNWVEVQKGLSVTDEVIVAGQQNLKEGAPIKIVPPGNENAAPPALAPKEGQL